jgi:hypothetical protein
MVTMAAPLRLSTCTAIVLLLSLSAGSAQQTVPPVPPMPTATDAGRLLRQGGPTTVIGSAWDADNRPLRGASVRLRSVSSGRIVAEAFANDAGEFAFTGIDSDTYVTELVDERGNLVAVGDSFTIDSGQTVVTFVRAPQQNRRLRAGGPFGWSTLTAAALGAAAGAGIMALRQCDCDEASPER